LKQCDWCNNYFEPNVPYQVYCTVTCRDEATKEKIAQRYVLARRNKRMGQDRKCKTCGSRLSAYNDDSICFSCVVNPKDVKDVLKEIRGLANGKAEPDIS
jgi:hypothetical protein